MRNLSNSVTIFYRKASLKRSKRRNRKNRGNRTAPARIEMKKGDAQILCPYCYPPHPIITDIPANCGTVLRLVAEQVVYTSVDCVLCGETGGTLIKIGESYRHDHDCTPGKTIYAVPPQRSRSAALLWHAPTFIHTFMARKFGRAITDIKNKEGDHAHYGWDMVRTIPMAVRADGRG